MKRVLVIGCPGSGKSTFSIQLSKIIQIPVIHLDNLFWNSDKTTVEKEVFIQRLKNAMNEEYWIIDGNYLSTMEFRLQKCDTVFFLDYPVEICLDGVKSRRGKVRVDIPWIEEEEDDKFIQFIKDFSTQSTPEIYKLLYKYSDKNIYHLKSRSDGEIVLKQLEMRNLHEKI